MNWDEAVSMPRTTGPNTQISSSVGAHNAYFIGFSEVYPDPFGETDKKTGGPKMMIGLKYKMLDGSIETEPMSFKISEAYSFVKDGKNIHLSSSKLYERLSMFSGLAAPGDLGRWAQANDVCKIPVTLIIKQPGNYPKITEVVLREERGTPPTEIASRAKANAQKAATIEDALAELEL